MTTHLIGTGWSIVADTEFERQIIDGDVLLWMPARTIHAAVYDTDGADADEAIQKMLEGRPGIPVQLFDRAEPYLVGHAYLLPESDKRHGYWGLNTWTASRGSVACVTIYFDHLDDLNWALSVWKSTRPKRAMSILN